MCFLLLRFHQTKRSVGESASGGPDSVFLAAALTPVQINEMIWFHKDPSTMRCVTKPFGSENMRLWRSSILLTFFNQIETKLVADKFVMRAMNTNVNSLAKQWIRCQKAKTQHVKLPRGERKFLYQVTVLPASNWQCWSPASMPRLQVSLCHHRLGISTSNTGSWQSHPVPSS